MNYLHRFVVCAPLARVHDFHCQAGSLPAITPLPLKVQLNHVPDLLGEDDEMDFSLGVGPLCIHRVAHIEHLSAIGFTDRQVDEITLRLRSQPLWWRLVLEYELDYRFFRLNHRKWGWLGGFPQTGLLRALGPRLDRNLWLVGDSIFPGQSTAAVALGSLRVAQMALREMISPDDPFVFLNKAKGVSV